MAPLPNRLGPLGSNGPHHAAVSQTPQLFLPARILACPHAYFPGFGVRCDDCITGIDRLPLSFYFLLRKPLAVDFGGLFAQGVRFGLRKGFSNR